MLAPARTTVRSWLNAAAFAFAYFLCATISRTLTTTLNFEAGFWLPSGLFLAVLLISEREDWPIYIGGSIVGSFAFNLQSSHWEFHLWLMSHAGNCLSAVVGAWLVQRFGERKPALHTVRELIAIFVFGALLSNMISATAGASVIKIFAARSPFWEVWRSWLLSNMLGVVLLTPAIIAWQGRDSWQRFRRHPRRIESVIIVGGVALVMYAGYAFRGEWLPPAVVHYLPLPFVIWAAIRFETRGVTVLSLVVALLAGTFSILDYGQPAAKRWLASGAKGNAQLQLNLVVFSFFGLFPAVVIAAHRRTMEELQASDARFHRALRGAGDGLWEWNLVTNASYFSPRWKEMLGFGEHELPNHREAFLARIHPDDRERMQKALRAHLEQGVPYDVEYRLLTRDTTYRWFRSRGQAERTPHGVPIRLAGTLQDVTDRVQAEESLRESRRALATLMSNLPGLAYRRKHDADWTLVFVSEGARELTGYSPSEMTEPAPFKLAALVHPDDREAVSLETANAVAEGRHYRLSYRILAAGGIEKWVWEQGTPVTGSEGELVALEGFIIDITERKRLEHQVLRAQRRESIGTLAAGVAHNLNNMLVPIVMGAELLKLPAGPKDNDRIIDNIETSARRAAELVRQLLAFGRGLDGARTTVSVTEVMREVESIVSSTFPKSIVFQSQTRGDLWAITGDPTQLHQVLLNLCLNARDAVVENARITLSARNEEIRTLDLSRRHGVSPGNYVCIEVADNGTGMSKEVCERIFEPFFTTKEVDKGTGLGLSTALGIVRSHGGSLYVTSVLGQGSCFTVLLPAQASGPSLSKSTWNAMAVGRI